MPMPRALREQEERANELHHQLYSQSEPGAADDDPATPETPAPAADTAQIENGQNAPAIQPENEDETPPEPEPYDLLKEQHRKLDAAHKTLQGKYRAEVPRLQEQVRDLQDQLIKAQQRQADAERSAQTARAEVGELQERLREEFGEETTDAIGEYARTVVRSELAQQRQTQPETPQPEQPQQPEMTPDQSRFWRTLRRRIPDFDAVNTSPEFVQWLQNPDPATGLPFQDTLNEAGADLDVESVIDVFKTFKHEQDNRRQAPPPTTAPEQQVAPNRRQRSAPKDKPTYTIADYQNLQQQILRGEWVGREAEAEALEREIHAALTGQ